VILLNAVLFRRETIRSESVTSHKKLGKKNTTILYIIMLKGSVMKLKKIQDNFLNLLPSSFLPTLRKKPHKKLVDSHHLPRSIHHCSQCALGQEPECQWSHLLRAQDAPGREWRMDAPSAAQALSASNHSANDHIKHRTGGADGEDGPWRDPPQPHT